MDPILFIVPSIVGWELCGIVLQGSFVHSGFRLISEVQSVCYTCLIARYGGGKSGFLP